jgi:hypothetical protein
MCGTDNIYELIDSMEQSPSWAANKYSVFQQIPRTLWKTEVGYRIQEPTTSPCSEPDRSSPCHPSHSLKIDFNILILSSHLRLSLLTALLLSGFPNKTLYVPLLFPILATCPVHLNLLNLVTRIIFDFNSNPV